MKTVAISSKSGVLGGAILALGAIIAIAPFAMAAPSADSQLTQEITAGALSTDIRDASGNVLDAPTFAMGSVPVSTSQQVSTGTFGDNNRRVTVDNPGGANGGWTLALNAECPTVGGSCTEVSEWTSGSNSYAYNGTAAAGQLTVDPAASTLSPTSPATATGIVRPAAQTFTNGDPIELLNASASSDDVWNGYLTGVGLDQTIPANTPVGAYSITMVQTVTAQ